ncbi:protein of unknown function [Cupriavidus taiwanensis]|uniref:Uncharacterized protein n=1 Tax=Cupriavidus taiwanensis TaxID=164546 RepID=A0A375I781_9BURK|nr:hypothetical protein CT19425_U100003 [Cupriavidus taiwanensis]SPK73271.1 protein of unknown function [Cupriavidus taiwanensis]
MKGRNCSYTRRVTGKRDFKFL